MPSAPLEVTAPAGPATRGLGREGVTAVRALADGAARLRAAGVPEPRRDARLLLGGAAGLSREALFAHPGRPLESRAARDFDRLIGRRAAREPVSRILGHREFWSLEFRITPDTLDPRPDSETVVAAALDRLPARAAPHLLLDLGTGCGCLLLALLSELPRAWGLGVDADARAVGVARANAVAHRLERRARFIAGDWGAAIRGRFNLVVTNPPYVPEGDIAALAPEVARHEPHRALAGGSDGLDAYRVLAPQLSRLLAPSGAAVIEVGKGSESAVEMILEEAGLALESRHRDLSGSVRALVVALRQRRRCQGKKGVGKRRRPD